MNRFKLEAFKKEFPFLKDILQGEPNRIFIKRADHNLLKSVPEYYYFDGSMGETKIKETVSFVLKGKILQNVVQTSYERGSNYANSQHITEEGESILEAIYRMQLEEELDPDEIQYIVWEREYLSDWQGSEYEDNYTVYIYKPPRKVTYIDIIRESEEKALLEVQIEANF